MIGPQELVEKANRLYPRAVKAWIDGQVEAMFPYRMPVDLSLPSDMAASIAEVGRLRSRAKQSIGYGYAISWESRRSRTHGLNEYPVAITLDSIDDLVALVGKQEEFATLQTAVAKVCGRQPEIGKWVCESTNWRKLIEVAESLDDLLLVVDYFQSHPRPDCFAREIPLAVSTKLIERNKTLLSHWLDRTLPPSSIDMRYGRESFEARYGLRYARTHFLIRLLDPELGKELGLPFDELSLPAGSLSKLPVDDVRVIIVENKVNLLTLPKVHRGIALGGLGNSVTQLSDIRWLKTAPIMYWGDIDVEGFQILSRLREHFPQTESVLMDRETLQAMQDQSLVSLGNPISQDRRPSQPPCLTAEEAELYQHILKHQLRVEQEHVPQAQVVNKLL